ncbi:SusC/RagA family TonB-linked outer membrane protein [Prevotella sp.]|uniref:SusC/RagA family TonB-linked outer membrane protein n=1 Tax=Prevotella sp. TaxID=59823 RepID=UPI002647BA64|nr:SusC/RagA family TonB-linked outer membrane protein [Prevotella sp.]MDN5554905.1 SusC/RagA family TonB-linked outer membrane protein [Prevotella sp.]
MEKRLLVFLACLFLNLGMALAQIRVSGTVSSDDGEPVVGASILVQGTKTGTVTDVDGNFQLTAPEGCELKVSYLGMKTKNVKVAANLKIVLQSDNRTLDDVVVTALGVSREKKALGYAVSEVKGSDLIKSRGGVSNPVNALQGKVAGLQISSSSGSMGGSSKIIIRGASSLSGNNQPLFVVDGVPIEGTDYNSTEVGSSDANSTARGAGGYDYGNLVQDINPDDIENISVLKGAAASALYGSRASNGVIMITTKRGQKDQGMGVEYSSTVGFETVTKLPKLQSQYGGGYGYAGSYNTSGSEADDFKTKTVNGVTYTVPDYRMDESWGPKLDGRQVVSWADLQKWETGGKVGNPTTSAWSPATSDYRDFFKTGVSYTNNVAISKAYDNSAFRISYTNTAMTGYLPNSSQYKNTVSVNGNIMSKDKKLNVFTSVNFFNSRTKGRQDTGYGDNNIMVKFTQWGQRQLNMDELEALYLKADGTQGSWNRSSFDNSTIPYHNNVYWSRYMNYENDSRNRIYGNVGLSYQILPQLKAQYKANLDFYVDKQYERNAVYSQELSAYKESSRQQYEINHEFMLMYNQAFGDYSVSANLGANIMQRHFELIYGETKGGLAIPLFYNLANSMTTPEAYNYKREKGINSLFGDVTIGWKSMLYLEATLRGDKSSTLPKANNTYVYPSVTASWLFSELLKDKAPWLSYGKLRAGYARVGNDTDPYQVMQTYTQYTNIDSSTPGYRLSNTLSNSNLKPESTKSWEFGLETSFFNNRLGFDLTYYTTTTSNEILPLSVSGSTGYMYKMINSGTIENKGVEFAFHATPVKTRKFEWTTNITLASNKNTVKSLADGVDYFKISTAPFKVEIGAVVGKPYGVIMGTNYVYDKNGNKCVDSKGLYMSTSGNEDIGHIYPDFTGGWSNSFKWGNFDASFQFDFSKGGHFFSTTQMWGYYCGMFEETAANGVRENGIISDGVVYKTGEKNTVRVSARDYYENYYNGPAAQSILRSDYIKLREVTVGYTFKLNPVWFIKSLRLSAYGRNLGVWGPDCKNFDPEMIVTSSGNIQGIEGGSTPMVANYGVTVNLKF